jgi:hypothetical protein
MTPHNERELLDIMRRIDDRTRAWTMLLGVFVFVGTAMLLIGLFADI